MHWQHWGGMSWSHMGFMWLGWVVLLVALVAAVWLVAAASARRRGGAEPTPESSPEKILKERYARGEIRKEQYDHMLEDLRH